MATLRSGQYWAGAGPEQLTDYVENLEPKLLAGMSYLVENKEKSGTLALRIMRNIDEAGRDRAETSVAAYFLSLTHLEGWAASHPTHEAIYEHAIEMALKYGDRREVVTWHELMVLPSCAAFEYVNCHPETGLLPYADLLFEEADR
jgi:aldoxime dehydratase